MRTLSKTTLALATLALLSTGCSTQNKIMGLHADTSGWDADQILRPIHTMNHKRGVPVTVRQWFE